MAYFANCSAGGCFEAQCMKCRFGQLPCPIAAAQYLYNYDACNNEVATNILDMLVKNDGSCAMFEMAPDVFGQVAA
jgi:hypothetical protein